MVTYTINGPILELKGEGLYSTADFEAVIVAAKDDEQLPLPTLLLIDMRETVIVHSFADVQARWSLVQQHLGPTIVPFIAVVVSGLARDRLAHIYQRRAEETSNIHIEVFTDPPAAREWLIAQAAPRR